MINPFFKQGQPRARSAGFTLIEVLVAIGIMSILMVLSAFALRTYWFVQSLEGATDELVTQLRESQSDSISQAFPRVFGLRFLPNDSGYRLLTYDPTQAAGSRCSSRDRPLTAGLFNAAVTIKTVAVTNTTTAPEFTTCRDEGDIAATDQVIFFYARGTATGGSITLEQPNSGRVETVTVAVPTGRVTRT